MTGAFRNAAKSNLASRAIQSRWQNTAQKSLGICDEPPRLAHTILEDRFPRSVVVRDVVLTS